MKNIKLLLVLVIIMASCSSGGGDDTPPIEENKAPGKVASLTYPTNNLLCISNTLLFEWADAIDPNGDQITYLLEISKNNQFSSIEESITSTNNNSKPVTLEKGIAYYWRVKATDSKGLSSDYSTVFQFYTEGVAEVNHLPFAPNLTAPTNNGAVSGATTNLQWNASDVDNDPLTYDVYFDTANPPTTKVGDNQSTKSLTVNINAATTYYWKVVAKDDKGGQALGQVWNFSVN
ncbi:hypothetical protein GCM10023314_11170 [Algibacter agarivorans]|uniref:Fibronectin type-III domain-containing protein n=1 Tax=Algibacter agarivorans TaxID=1109741 RepID=A0ABP9GEB3_9FLAO